MKTDNIIKDKSFAFAVRIVKVYKYLITEKKEFILSKQLLRSATSVGANIEEAIGGRSTADFLHKISISYKESRETLYWLRLLYETDYLTKQEADSLIQQSTEICRILSKIQISIKATCNS